MGEYRRARGSLHVRGAFWLRSQVPIRRAKDHFFTQDEDIQCHTYIHLSTYFLGAYIHVARRMLRLYRIAR
jgi:hypothetical protein